MSERRRLGEQARVNELRAGEVHRPVGVDQQVDRLEAGRERRLDEVFALTNEEAEPFALPAGRQAPHETEPRVGRRGDHGPSHSSHWPWNPAWARSTFSSSGQSRSQMPQ